ncbi:hypothetical protein E2C01_050353 [Portunus trituberculatus]|uniref:Uncharacterized protein n=1 Tax=Portunus trituberculatus TaxID=210409 RepID=A0A5B7GG97_PORTR|nr:hypothetical protein [Portunus trituberculatus]
MREGGREGGREGEVGRGERGREGRKVSVEGGEGVNQCLLQSSTHTTASSGVVPSSTMAPVTPGEEYRDTS